MASAEQRWKDLTDVSLLLMVIAKGGTPIPYNEIAQELGVTYRAVQARIQRLKKKYGDDAAIGSAGAAAEAEEAPVAKKRKRNGDAGGGSSGKKKAKTAKLADIDVEVLDEEE